LIYPDKKVVVGITGGMGSGKSTVTGFFEKNGAIAIYADQLAKFYTSKDSPIKIELKELFGSSVIFENGEVDRKLISNQIFQNPEKYRSLTNLIHPKVRMETREKIHNSPPKSLIAWEVPLLFETGGDAICTHTICVHAEEKQAIDRVRLRDGLNEIEYKNRMKFQMKIEEKFEKAEFKIENNSSLQELERKSLELYYIIRKGT